MQEPQPPEVAVKKLQAAQVLVGWEDMAVQCSEFRELTSSELIFVRSTQALSAALAASTAAAATSAPPIEIWTARVSNLRRDIELIIAPRLLVAIVESISTRDNRRLHPESPCPFEPM
jgi:hypothetical protein